MQLVAAPAGKPPPALDASSALAAAHAVVTAAAVERVVAGRRAQDPIGSVPGVDRVVAVPGDHETPSKSVDRVVAALVRRSVALIVCGQVVGGPLSPMMVLAIATAAVSSDIALTSAMGRRNVLLRCLTGILLGGWVPL